MITTSPFWSFKFIKNTALSVSISSLPIFLKTVIDTVDFDNSNTNKSKQRSSYKKNIKFDVLKIRGRHPKKEIRGVGTHKKWEGTKRRRFSFKPPHKTTGNFWLCQMWRSSYQTRKREEEIGRERKEGKSVPEEEWAKRMLANAVFGEWAERGLQVRTLVCFFIIRELCRWNGHRLACCWPSRRSRCERTVCRGPYSGLVTGDCRTLAASAGSYPFPDYHHHCSS